MEQTRGGKESKESRHGGRGGRGGRRREPGAKKGVVKQRRKLVERIEEQSVALTRAVQIAHQRYAKRQTEEEKMEMLRWHPPTEH